MSKLSRNILALVCGVALGAVGATLAAKPRMAAECMMLGSRAAFLAAIPVYMLARSHRSLFCCLPGAIIGLCLGIERPDTTLLEYQSRPIAWWIVPILAACGLAASFAILLLMLLFRPLFTKRLPRTEAGPAVALRVRAWKIYFILAIGGLVLAPLITGIYGTFVDNVKGGSIFYQDLIAGCLIASVAGAILLPLIAIARRRHYVREMKYWLVLVIALFPASVALQLFLAFVLTFQFVNPWHYGGK